MRVLKGPMLKRLKFAPLLIYPLFHLGEKVAQANVAHEKMISSERDEPEKMVSHLHANSKAEFSKTSSFIDQKNLFACG